MFKRIAKIFGIVLACSIVFIGGLIGVLALQGKFKKQYIYPKSINFNIEKIGDSDQFTILDSSDPKNIKLKYTYYANDFGKNIHCFSLGADSENVNMRECVISIEKGNELIAFCDENGNNVEQSETFLIGKKYYFRFVDTFDKLSNEDYENGVITMFAHDSKSICSCNFTLYVDRLVTDISIEDTKNTNHNEVITGSTEENNQNGKFSIDELLKIDVGTDEDYPINIIGAPNHSLKPFLKNAPADLLEQKETLLFYLDNKDANNKYKIINEDTASNYDFIYYDSELQQFVFNSNKAGSFYFVVCAFESYDAQSEYYKSIEGITPGEVIIEDKITAMVHRNVAFNVKQTSVDKVILANDVPMNFYLYENAEMYLNDKTKDNNLEVYYYKNNNVVEGIDSIKFLTKDYFEQGAFINIKNVEHEINIAFSLNGENRTSSISSLQSEFKIGDIVINTNEANSYSIKDNAIVINVKGYKDEELRQSFEGKLVIDSFSENGNWIFNFKKMSLYDEQDRLIGEEQFSNYFINNSIMFLTGDGDNKYITTLETGASYFVIVDGKYSNLNDKFDISTTDNKKFVVRPNADILLSNNNLKMYVLCVNSNSDYVVSNNLQVIVDAKDTEYSYNQKSINLPISATKDDDRNISYTYGSKNVDEIVTATGTYKSRFAFASTADGIVEASPLFKVGTDKYLVGKLYINEFGELAFDNSINIKDVGEIKLSIATLKGDFKEKSAEIIDKCLSKLNFKCTSTQGANWFIRPNADDKIKNGCVVYNETDTENNYVGTLSEIDIKLESSNAGKNYVLTAKINDNEYEFVSQSGVDLSTLKIDENILTVQGMYDINKDDLSFNYTIRSNEEDAKNAYGTWYDEENSMYNILEGYKDINTNNSFKLNAKINEEGLYKDLLGKDNLDEIIKEIKKHLTFEIRAYDNNNIDRTSTRNWTEFIDFVSKIEIDENNNALTTEIDCKKYVEGYYFKVVAKYDGNLIYEGEKINIISNKVTGYEINQNLNFDPTIYNSNGNEIGNINFVCNRYAYMALISFDATSKEYVTKYYLAQVDKDGNYILSQDELENGDISSTIVYKPSYARDFNYSVSASSNDSIDIVNNDGKCCINAKKPGTAEISIKYTKNSGIYLNVDVIVKANGFEFIDNNKKTINKETDLSEILDYKYNGESILNNEQDFKLSFEVEENDNLSSKTFKREAVIYDNTIKTLSDETEESIKDNKCFVLENGKIYEYNVVIKAYFNDGNWKIARNNAYANNDYTFKIKLSTKIKEFNTDYITYSNPIQIQKMKTVSTAYVGTTFVFGEEDSTKHGYNSSNSAMFKLINKTNDVNVNFVCNYTNINGDSGSIGLNYYLLKIAFKNAGKYTFTIQGLVGNDVIAQAEFTINVLPNIIANFTNTDNSENNNNNKQKLYYADTLELTDRIKFKTFPTTGIEYYDYNISNATESTPKYTLSKDENTEENSTGLIDIINESITVNWISDTDLHNAILTIAVKDDNSNEYKFNYYLSLESGINITKLKDLTLEANTDTKIDLSDYFEITTKTGGKLDIQYAKFLDVNDAQKTVLTRNTDGTYKFNGYVSEDTNVEYKIKFYIGDKEPLFEFLVNSKTFTLTIKPLTLKLTNTFLIAGKEYKIEDLFEKDTERISSVGFTFVNSDRFESYSSVDEKFILKNIDNYYESELIQFTLTYADNTQYIYCPTFTVNNSTKVIINYTLDSTTDSTTMNVDAINWKNLDGTNYDTTDFKNTLNHFSLINGDKISYDISVAGDEINLEKDINTDLVRVKFQPTDIGSELNNIGINSIELVAVSNIVNKDMFTIKGSVITISENCYMGYALFKIRSTKNSYMYYVLSVLPNVVQYNNGMALDITNLEKNRNTASYTIKLTEDTKLEGIIGKTIDGVAISDINVVASLTSNIREFGEIKYYLINNENNILEPIHTLNPVDTPENKKIAVILSSSNGTIYICNYSFKILPNIEITTGTEVKENEQDEENYSYYLEKEINENSIEYSVADLLTIKKGGSGLKVSKVELVSGGSERKDSSGNSIVDVNVANSENSKITFNNNTAPDDYKFKLTYDNGLVVYFTFKLSYPVKNGSTIIADVGLNSDKNAFNYDLDLSGKNGVSDINSIDYSASQVKKEVNLSDKKIPFIPASDDYVANIRVSLKNGVSYNLEVRVGKPVQLITENNIDKSLIAENVVEKIVVDTADNKEISYEYGGQIGFAIENKNIEFTNGVDDNNAQKVVRVISNTDINVDENSFEFRYYKDGSYIQDNNYIYVDKTNGRILFIHSPVDYSGILRVKLPYTTYVMRTENGETRYDEIINYIWQDIYVEIPASYRIDTVYRYYDKDGLKANYETFKQNAQLSLTDFFSDKLNENNVTNLTNSRFTLEYTGNTEATNNTESAEVNNDIGIINNILNNVNNPYNKVIISIDNNAVVAFEDGVFKFKSPGDAVISITNSMGLSLKYNITVQSDDQFYNSINYDSSLALRSDINEKYVSIINTKTDSSNDPQEINFATLNFAPSQDLPFGIYFENNTFKDNNENNQSYLTLKEMETGSQTVKLNVIYPEETVEVTAYLYNINGLIEKITVVISNVSVGKNYNTELNYQTAYANNSFSMADLINVKLGDNFIYGTYENDSGTNERKEVFGNTNNTEDANYALYSLEGVGYYTSFDEESDIIVNGSLITFKETNNKYSFFVGGVSQATYITVVYYLKHSDKVLTTIKVRMEINNNLRLDMNDAINTGSANQYKRYAVDLYLAGYTYDGGYKIDLSTMSVDNNGNKYNNLYLQLYDYNRPENNRYYADTELASNVKIYKYENLFSGIETGDLTISGTTLILKENQEGKIGILVITNDALSYGVVYEITVHHSVSVAEKIHYDTNSNSAYESGNPKTIVSTDLNMINNTDTTNDNFPNIVIYKENKVYDHENNKFNVVSSEISLKVQNNSTLDGSNSGCTVSCEVIKNSQDVSYLTIENNEEYWYNAGELTITKKDNNYNITLPSVDMDGKIYLVSCKLTFTENGGSIVRYVHYLVKNSVNFKKVYTTNVIEEDNGASSESKLTIANTSGTNALYSCSDISSIFGDDTVVKLTGLTNINNDLVDTKVITDGNTYSQKCSNGVITLPNSLFFNETEFDLEIWKGGIKIFTEHWKMNAKNKIVPNSSMSLSELFLRDEEVPTKYFYENIIGIIAASNFETDSDLQALINQSDAKISRHTDDEDKGVKATITRGNISWTLREVTYTVAGSSVGSAKASFYVLVGDSLVIVKYITPGIRINVTINQTEANNDYAINVNNYVQVIGMKKIDSNNILSIVDFEGTNEYVINSTDWGNSRTDEIGQKYLDITKECSFKIGTVTVQRTVYIRVTVKD